MIATTRGAVIVTRVSTGEQVKHGTSLEGQLEICRAKAQTLDLPIVAEYKDPGLSGAYYILREGMQQAIADIKAGRADTLICANMSRYSRDVEHQQSIRKEVRAAGGNVVFCDMQFDDTPEGDLAFSIMGGFAEYERKVIRARTMRGKRKRAEEGQQPQRSRPPYGYHIITNAEVECGRYPQSERGHYVIVEDKAAVVRRIFSEYVEGRSTLPRICRALNDEVIPSPGNKRLWQHATVRVILTNPVYKGEPVSGKQRCHTDESRIGQPHKWTGRPITRPDVRENVPESLRLKLSAPALVSEELWNAAQARLDENRTFGKGNPRRVQMLSGRTFCPYCGDRTIIKYQISNGNKYRYLVCAKRRKASTLTGDKVCTGDLYPVDSIETSTVRVLQEAWQKPESVEAATLVYLSEKQNKDSSSDAAERELPRLEQALSDLRREEAAAVQGQIAGIRAGASPDAYRDIFADVAARRKDLEDRRGVLKAAVGRNRAERVDKSPRTAESTIQTALHDAWRVLSDPDVPG